VRARESESKRERKRERDRMAFTQDFNCVSSILVSTLALPVKRGTSPCNRHMTETERLDEEAHVLSDQPAVDSVEMAP